MKPLSILIQNFVGDRVGAVTRVVRSKILKIKGCIKMTTKAQRKAIIDEKLITKNANFRNYAQV